jgi:cytochrome c-type protein NapC
MQASKEVWGKIFGTINTREKFLEHRLELAQHEWARLKANDSLECRNCHNYKYMDWTRQSDRAVYVHSTALAGKDYTCIDCHKGIAHSLPDMEGIEMLYGAPPEEIAPRSDASKR